MVDVTPERKQEIYDDTIKHCNTILDFLKNYEGGNDDPEGRIIYQCEWLIQEINKNKLPIPFDSDVINMSHTCIEHDLLPEAGGKDIYRYMDYITTLAGNKLLMKKEHYPLAIEEIEKLLIILNNSPRKLSEDEKNMLPELNDIKDRLSNTNTLLPIDPNEKAFTNIWKLYRYTKSTIDDIPEAHEHLNRIANMVFQSVRDKVVEW